MKPLIEATLTGNPRHRERYFEMKTVRTLFRRSARLVAIGPLAALLCGAAPALAVPILGADLASFAVLGATGVTNVPTSTIGGNLGSAPSASVGGGYVFTSGSLQSNTPLAQNAQLQLDAAILALNSLGAPTLLGSGDLTTLGTIFPGNYTVPNAAINISGALTLDGGGSNTAVWVFHFPSTTLTTSTISTVNVVNVGDGAGVGLYWNVGSTAVLNGPTFAGNVLAGASITSDGGLTIACGRLLAATGNVTLIQDTISLGCTGFERSGGFDQGVDIGSVGQVVPEPATLLLFGFGLAGLGFMRRKRAA